MRRTPVYATRIPLFAISLITVFSLLLVAAAPMLPVGLFYALEPKNFGRTTGKPAVQYAQFAVLNPDTTYTMKIYNGGMNGEYKKKVSSAVISLNGKVVVGPKEFNQQVLFIEKQVKLQKNNKLKVELRSAPKSGITIEIIGVDEEIPTITASVAPPANPEGWNNGPVDVTFTCSDTISGVKFCTGANIPAGALLSTVKGVVHVTAEGETEVVGMVEDRARNTATTSVIVKIDSQPPAIQAVLSPAPNAAGWNNSDVVVSFACSDAGSGVATCPAPVTVSAEGSTPVTGTATDVAGNSASTTVTVKIDKTAPVVTITSPVAGAIIDQGPAVTLTGTVTDTGSGIASVMCSDTIAATLTGSSFTCDVRPTANGLYIFTVVATDRAGNTGSATVSVTYNGPVALGFKKK